MAPASKGTLPPRLNTGVGAGIAGGAPVSPLSLAPSTPIPPSTGLAPPAVMGGSGTSPSSKRPSGAGGAGGAPIAPLPTSVSQMAQGICMRLLVDGHVGAYAELFSLLDLSDMPGLSPGFPGKDEALGSRTSTGASAKSALGLSPAHLQRLAKLLATREEAQLRAHQRQRRQMSVSGGGGSTSAAATTSGAFSAPRGMAAIADVYSATRSLAQYLAQIMPAERPAAVRYAQHALAAARALAVASIAAGSSGGIGILSEFGTPSTPFGLGTPAPGEKAINAFPAVLDSYVTLADAFAQHGDFDAAIEHYKHALIVPEAVERMVVVAHGLAAQMERAGHWFKARDLYENILRTIPNDHPASAALAMDLRRRMGLTLMELEELATARELLHGYLAWATQDAASLRAAAAAARGRQAPPAPMGGTSHTGDKTGAPAALADGPPSHAGHPALASLSLLPGDIDPLGIAYVALATCYDRMGNLEAAVDTLMAYLAATPADVESPSGTRAMVELPPALRGASAAGANRTTGGPAPADGTENVPGTGKYGGGVPVAALPTSSSQLHRARVLLGNLLNRLGRTAEAVTWLRVARDPSSGAQLGIARGCDVFPAFLEAVKISPQRVMQFLDQVSTSRHGMAGRPPMSPQSHDVAAQKGQQAQQGRISLYNLLSR